MPTHRLMRVVLLLAIVGAAVVSHPPAAVRASGGGDPSAVITWNGHALRAIVDTAPRQPPTTSVITLSYVQAAVYNAVLAIEGGYAPYHSNLEPQPEASLDAAVAAATYAVLVHYLPAQQVADAGLPAAYTDFLAALSDGPSKAAGVALGQAAAAEIIALRQGDGYLGPDGFVMPAPGPGAWELPPGAIGGVTPWVAHVRPFMLNSQSQFRPGPPPPLNSAEWAKQYNEVLSVGRNTSLTRTPAQTDAARFWTDQPTWQYNTLYQEVAAAHGLNAVETARLFAMGNLTGADAGIACWDAKYHYLFWRPEPAINRGDSDGNLRTIADPAWKPLIGTPPHPEYPSGHGCVTSALAEVLTVFLGTNQINVDVHSRVTGLTGPTRHFNTANDLRREIIDVRVWSGIHFRYSDLTGAKIGREVAHWALQRYFGH